MRTVKDISRVALEKIQPLEATKTIYAFEHIKDANESFVIDEMNGIKRKMREKCSQLYFIWSVWGFSTELFKNETIWNDFLENLDRDLDDIQDFDEEGKISTLKREEVEDKLEKEFMVFLLLYIDYCIYNKRLKELQDEYKRHERIQSKTDLGISWQAADEIYKILTTEFFPHSCTPYIVCDKNTWDNLCDGKPNKAKKIKLNEGSGSQQLIMDILNVIGYEYNSVMKERLNEYFGLPNRNVSLAKSRKGESDLLLRLRNIVGKYEK